MIGQAEFFITPPGRQRTYGACLLTAPAYARKPSQSFLSLKILRRFFQTVIMAEEFPSFDLGFDFLNDQNNAETATDQKKRSADVKETETNQLLLEVQSREMSANAVETNSRSTTMSTMIHGEMLRGMFNSCTIHSVQINLNRPQDAKTKLFEL